MLRLIKISLFVWLAIQLAPVAHGFALLGPFGTNQVERIGYNVYGRDIGGPMNKDQGYRWNKPIITYALDASFLQFFGSNGVVAVEQAMNLLNSYSTNLYKISDADLKKVPLNTARNNYKAQALSIYDLKSYILAYMMEEVGLASPDRYAYCLLDRRTFTNPDFTNYVVTTLNFDPITLNQTPYVNGTMYTYQVFDTYLRDPDVADAIEFPVDPLSFTQTAVASAIDNVLVFSSKEPGRFFTGLTRDDVAGLRYLYATNNYRLEYLPSDGNNIVELAVTNLTNPMLITTSNLVELIDNSWGTTNTPTQLLAIYPTLNLTSTNYGVSNFVTTNVTYYYTNYPYTPVGSTPVLASNVWYTYTPTLVYYYTFDNVVTNHYSSNSLASLISTEVGFGPYSPVDAPITTNISIRSFYTNRPAGDYYIIPQTNQNFYFVLTNISTVITNTNVTYAVTNTFSNSFLTNIVSTNSTNFYLTSTQQDLVFYSTNYSYLAYPIEWRQDSNTVGMRPGMGSLLFKKVDYDSLIGTNMTPITNYYTDVMVVTNGYNNKGTFLKQTVRIRSSAPDIVFYAIDLGLDDDGYPIASRRTGTGNWQNNSAINQGIAASGPGVIKSPVQFEFSNIGRYYINRTPSFLTEQSGFLGFMWGTFDGSTNAPIVYPDNGGDTLRWLEKEILGQ